MGQRQKKAAPTPGGQRQVRNQEHFATVGADRETERARSALWHLDSSCSRAEWFEIGCAAKDAGISFDDFHAWSEQAGNYAGARDVQDMWKSIKPDGRTTERTLFDRAMRAGWQDDGRAAPAPRAPARQPTTEPERPRQDPAAIWEACEPATAEHGYIVRKGGNPDGLRVYRGPLKIAGVPMAGRLVLPARDAAGAIKTLQFVDPQKRDDRKGKLNLPGWTVSGWHAVGAFERGAAVYIVEGIGAAWTTHAATGCAALVAFGAGNMERVAQAAQAAGARPVLVADRGKEAETERAAERLRCAWVAMPEDLPEGSDINDLQAAEGIEAVCAVLDQLREPAGAETAANDLPLGIVFADELGDDFEPPDELVEGLLTTGAGSILYGDSNSGKTFLTIDMACAVARGVDWMGRRTEPGLVVYVAAESPASVKSRLQAYQAHHRCKVPNFAIVQHPINLYEAGADTDALILAIKAVEQRTGKKACLVVGDTLARLAAGSNENSGEDMGIVVKHFDRIRLETGAHFLLIHHSGKDQAKGARGHSSLRAAVDTEIEVTDTAKGRCAEVTKQRDLATKGYRLGFSLKRVVLGVTKWGEEASTCIVEPSEAPPKGNSKGDNKINALEGAVLQYLREVTGARRSDVVKKFEKTTERPKGKSKTVVYEAIANLVELGLVHEAKEAGMVGISDAGKAYGF